jgi:hypothetical protein
MPDMPVSVIGPEPIGTSGARVVVDAASHEQFTPFEGEKAKPAPMIPPEIKMSDEQLKRLALYLDHELTIASSERFEFINRLARFKEKYRTKFPEFPKDWPIANSSQIVIPVIKTAVHTLTARIYQTIMAAEPPASIRTEDPEYQDFAYDYEKFFEVYADERLDLPEVLDGWVTELIKLGTGVLEVTTKLDRRAEMEYDTLEGKYKKRVAERFSGPIIYHIPLEDFWIRPAYQNPETAPWCGKEVRLSWSQIKDMALSGDLNPKHLDDIWKYSGSGDLDVPKTVKKQEEIEKLRPTDRSTYSLFELTVRWDVDGCGNDEELMVYFHKPSRTILRRKFSGFTRRPWRVGRFIPIEHWFYAEGMCEILEHLQEEISTIHNQRIDNATIANLRIILVARLLKGLRPGDRLWSGKVVRVQSVKEDVGTLQLGDVYPSTVANENISNQYVERVSGIGETATGTAQPVTRTTATAQLALLEELNRRFDKVVKGLRRTLRGVYRDTTDLFFKMGTGGLAEEWLGPVRGRRLEQFLMLPSDLLKRKVKIQITSTRSTINREVEFQSQLAVWNLLQQMWQQVLQTTQMLGPQAAAVIPLLAHEFVKAVQPVMKKVMQYADAPDPEQAISVLSVLERILPAPEDMGGMGGAQASEDANALVAQLQQRTAADVGGEPGAGGATPRANGNRGVATPQPVPGATVPGGF